MNYLDNVFSKVSHWNEELWVSEATIIKLLELCTVGETVDWEKHRLNASQSIMLKVKERNEKFPVIIVWKLVGTDKFILDQIATPDSVLVDIPLEIQFIIMLETRNQ